MLAVRRADLLAMGSDGQVTLGELVVKENSVKIRRLYGDRVLVGFAGSVADALALFERFERHLEQYRGQLRRAAVELAKEWRMDRALRRLEAVMIVGDAKDLLLLSGQGDVLEPEEPLLATGSGAGYALAAARALYRKTELSAEEIVREALHIAGSLDLYSNQHITVEVLQSGAAGSS